ncbi:hypothetical protein HK102_011171, partial [Quaeritorhiza haematococci]
HCLSCASESTCPYSAKRIYLDAVKRGHRGWPLSVIADVPDVESVERVLRDGPYGRCVYESDNDVMDNQVVIMQFEGGRTANFSMIACTEEVCQRKTKIFGSRGELIGDGLTITHFDFTTGKSTTYEPYGKDRVKGVEHHGGGDTNLVAAFLYDVSVSIGIDAPFPSTLESLFPTPTPSVSDDPYPYDSTTRKKKSPATKK